MKIFCNRLKELRTEKKLSQKSLAEILKTNNSSICDWERERAQPDLDTLTKIAIYFHVSTDYLLGLEDETGSKTINKNYLNLGTHNGDVNIK